MVFIRMPNMHLVGILSTYLGLRYNSRKLNLINRDLHTDTKVLGSFIIQNYALNIMEAKS
jgi:hypothetical protein